MRRRNPLSQPVKVALGLTAAGLAGVILYEIFKPAPAPPTASASVTIPPAVSLPPVPTSAVAQQTLTLGQSYGFVAQTNLDQSSLQAAMNGVGMSNVQGTVIGSLFTGTFTWGSPGTTGEAVPTIAGITWVSVTPSLASGTTAGPPSYSSQQQKSAVQNYQRQVLRM